MRETILTGVDIGSTKIAVVVGQLDRERNLHILGATHEPTRGIKRGGIVDIDEVANSLARAVERAAHLTGQRISRAYCSISGAHIQSQNHRGTVAITPTNRDIDTDDIAHVLDVAGSIPLDANRMVLAVLPRAYLVDGQDGIKNPAGMAGYRLEAEAHIVTGANSAYRNLLKCAERAHLEVADLVVAPLASAEAVLSPGERDQGTALFDLGGGTAEIALYAEGGVWHTGMLPLGGQLLIEDIVYALQLPYPVAEAVLVQYGTASAARVPANETLDLGQFMPNCREVASRRKLALVIEARIEDTLVRLRDEVRRVAGEQPFTGGIVLTGGVAELPGITEVAARVFAAPVRLGAPHSLYGTSDTALHPAYATAIGLLRWQCHAQAAVESAPQASLWQRLWSGMQDMVLHK